MISWMAVNTLEETSNVLRKASRRPVQEVEGTRQCPHATRFRGLFQRLKVKSRRGCTAA